MKKYFINNIPLDIKLLFAAIIFSIDILFNMFFFMLHKFP